MVKSKIKILSIGGSILIPKTGFNIDFLKKFRKLIIDEVKKGQKFILVIGGGATCRTYQEALQKINTVSIEELDLLGIQATYLNSELVRLFFGSLAFDKVIKNPYQKIKTSKSIIIAGGFKPGCSTDTIAVLLAKQFHSAEIINISNVEYIYDKDPNIFKNAKKLESVSWKDLQKIVGSRWMPGGHFPFDPIAVKLAKELNLKVFFTKGTTIKNIKNVLEGKNFKGTIIV